LHKDPTIVGEVIQVGWESDDEDQEEIEENEILVEWLGETDPQVVPVADIFVSDKTFIRENLVVLKSSHKQSGTITKVSTFVDLQFINGTVLANVPITKLKFLFDCEADYCLKNECMGVITDQTEFLRIRFGDNPRDFFIESTDVSRNDENERSLRTEVGIFLPGQKVYVEDFDELFNTTTKIQNNENVPKKK